MASAAPATGRTLFVGANWKCNGTIESTKTLANDLAAKVDTTGVDVVVAPVALHLQTVRDTLEKSPIEVAVQNISATGSGAFTGEIAPEMVVDFGLKWAIIGHSERRSYYGETDEIVTKKVANALLAGLHVIVCLGETGPEREGGLVQKVTLAQLEAIVAGVTQADYWSRVVLAYEPVWAIGTGKVCAKEDAQSVHNLLRTYLNENVGAEVAAATRILYGGSVKGSNAGELIEQEDIDGFLVGGAALKAETFAPIIAAAQAQSKL
jgi:triosephosphate isomerase